jgi:hypothetical protein
MKICGFKYAQINIQSNTKSRSIFQISPFNDELRIVMLRD